MIVDIYYIVYVICITELKLPQKMIQLKSCVKELPIANYETLTYLSNHLRKYEMFCMYSARHNLYYHRLSF